MSPESSTQPFTDVTSHHIEGYTNVGYVKIPLITEIMPNFWQGGCIGGVHLPDDFQTVVSLYQWEEYVISPNTERFTIEMYDSSDVPDQHQIDSLADLVNTKRKEGKTLVHCQAGLNRSGLVCARALMLDGYSADDAITLLRKSRSPLVLCNPAFEYWLRNVEVN